MELASSNFQDSFLKVHSLKLCKQTHFGNFVIKAGFHRLWLISILLNICIKIAVFSQNYTATAAKFDE